MEQRIDQLKYGLVSVSNCQRVKLSPKGDRVGRWYRLLLLSKGRVFSSEYPDTLYGHNFCTLLVSGAGLQQIRIRASVLLVLRCAILVCAAGSVRATVVSLHRDEKRLGSFATLCDHWQI